MRAAVIIAILVCAGQIAAAQEAARPAKQGKTAPGAPQQQQPQDLSPPQGANAAAPESAAALAAPSACQARLANVAVFRPIPDLVGPGECGAPDAVLLQQVILPDQGKVQLTPPATLRCTMAEEVVHWVREDVAPAAAKLGAPLRGLDNFDSYECRGRNRVPGAKLSEHGRANALDVRGFRLGNGQDIGLTDVHVAKTWREGIKANACARFSTVLGPGSDGYHETHIHLDLAERRGGYKICHWEVHDLPQVARTPPQEAAPQPDEAVPLPRPRPREARARRGAAERN